ncbi:MAG: FtsW/RodA/SpoVE family cell cycle protein, partial [Bdellovibrionales bacterium]|nr:FtsW/RodA/SpoVE family cell cycle protein [Bdellovibrionales bacterium]
PYREARIRAFLDPWSDPAQKGFQVIQSMLAFSSGGLWGEGLGQGQGKLFFLPEAHTDFILAVFGEEMGFVGIAFVLTLYGFVVFKGFQFSVRLEDKFAQSVALGLTMTLGLSIFVNMGVVMGLLPTKGLTLPLMSYGGSSLLSTCFACGILLNLGKEGVRLVPQFRGFKI